MIIAEMVMVRKHLKLLKVKSKLKFQEIEMVHLNLQLFLKDKKMYQLLKVRYSDVCQRNVTTRYI